MSTKYCYLCKRWVVPTRKIGIGTLILALCTWGLSLFLIPFYSKRCPICQNSALTSNAGAAQ